MTAPVETIDAHTNDENARLRDAALALAAAGFPVFPCDGKRPRTTHGLKDASTDEATIRDWWASKPWNIGLRTGAGSGPDGLVAIDVDGPTGAASLVSLEGTRHRLPETAGQATPSGGRHLLFQHPGGDIRPSAGALGDGLDIRGDDAYIIVAPSAGYRWEYGHSLLDGVLASLPEWWAHKLSATAPTLAPAATSTDTGPTVRITEGKRNAALTSIAGKYREWGWSETRIAAELQMDNVQHCDPTLDVSEVAKIAQSVAGYSAGIGMASAVSFAKAADGLLDDRLGAGFDLSTVTAESINWLWRGHVPIGKMTLFDGDPGLGKSVMALDIAARVTTGRDMPDGSPGGPPAYVIVLTAEDGIADTVRPRADAAGADCRRIRIIEDFPDKDGEHTPSIPGDIDALDQVIRQTGAKLVIIDPLSAYLGSEGGDGNNDPKVRRALAPLAKMAERTGVAVILIRHLVKDSDKKALYRGGGSIGIIGASRAAYIVAADNEGDDNDRVIAPTKFNLGPKPDALKFSTESAVVGDIETVRIAWRGHSLQTADSLLAAPPEPGKLEEAIDFLKDRLTGYRVAAPLMFKEANGYGITEKTLRRAKGKLRVESVKSDMSDGWFWELPRAGTDEDGHVTPPTQPLAIFP